MGTVDKALKLLNYFSLANPEWGLSELARVAGVDKATALRLLRSMEKHGLIEQDDSTKRFRLGPAFLTFARIRELNSPLSAVIKRHLNDLSSRIRETAHASLASDTAMTTIAISEPDRAAWIHLDPAEALPFHATASGICYLAFGPQAARDAIAAQGNLVRFTDKTEVSVDQILEMVAKARSQGYWASFRTFEPETSGIAVPVFDQNGLAQGAMGIATPSMRMTEELKQRIVDALMEATLKLAEEIGARLPDDYPVLASAGVGG